MTERPEGAPDAEPADEDAAPGEPEAAPGEPEAAPEAETVTVAPEAAAAADEALEGAAGEFVAETEAADADEIEDELEAEEAEEAEAAEAAEAADAFEDETSVPLGAEPAVAGGAAVGAPVARRRGVPTPSAQRAPTLSEQAVHVADPASRLFVVATVVVFAAILAFGLLGGNGGLLTKTPPPTVAPSVSAAPSESAGASPSAAPSVEVSASPS